MSLKQSILDLIRAINKRTLNRITIKIAGLPYSPFTILYHVGRKSGNKYSIPIIVEPIDKSFVIALTYGTEVDWYKNVIAKGSCSIKWKNKEYLLANPILIEKSLGLSAFPLIPRIILNLVGIKYFLKLTN